MFANGRLQLSSRREYHINADPFVAASMVEHNRANTSVVLNVEFMFSNDCLLYCLFCISTGIGLIERINATGVWDRVL